MNKLDLRRKIKQNKELVIRQAGLVVLDIFIVAFSMIFTLWIRCDFGFEHIEPKFLESIWRYMGINIICTLLIFWLFRLYSSLWRFASVVELSYVVIAVMCSAMVQFLGMRMM